MQELKPNWKMALKVSLLHSQISSQITSVIVLTGIIIAGIVLGLTGHHVNLALFVNYFLKYRNIIILIILIIHFIPVNLYAIIQVLQHRYHNFRIVLVPNEKSHETDHRHHQTF